jgi:prolyl oligopeptidase PreP (S9A serine peptidase family)
MTTLPPSRATSSQGKITSPRRVGIEGGSNGGLLMGLEFTQRPELWNAVAIQVPTLGILRYEVIEGGHGASANPKERVHTALEMTYFAKKLID